VIQFHHPAALIGLIAALAPLIIYFLLRRRRQEVLWGASYLLRLTLATRRKSSLWKQLIVLAVRTLILALAAVLVARPWRVNPAPKSLAPALPAESVHRLVLIDNSLSMSVSAGGDSRLSRLRAVLAPLLESQRAGDTTTLVPLVAHAEPKPEADRRRSGTPSRSDADSRGTAWSAKVLRSGARPEPVVLVGALSRGEVVARTTGVSLREGTINLRAALVQALAHLASTPQAAAELYVLSDFPRELADRLQQIDWFKQVAAERSLRLIPVNMISPDGFLEPNASIRDIRIGSDLVLAGVPTVVYVTVQNFSDTELAARLQFDLDGAKQAEKTVLLQPNERKRAGVGLVFPRPGVSVLKVAIDKSRVGVDSETPRCVEVRRSPKVWLYADEADPREGASLAESEFILRGAAVHRGKETPLELVEVGVPQLARPVPQDVAVLILAGPRVITPKMGENITAFVRQGGGLIVGMSPKIDVSFYNENLGKLLPAPLVRPARGEVDPQAFALARPKPARDASELFTEFAAEVSGELDEIRFYDHLLLENADQLGGVVFRLTNGDPLLVHRTFGRGHVYLFTSSFGASWSSFPVRQSFIPLVHRLINAAMVGRGFARNIEPGGTFIAAWPDSTPGELVRPDGDRAVVAPVRGPQKRFVMVEDAALRGLYELRRNGKRTEAFTVTGQFAEADLRTLTGEQQERLAGLLGHRVYPDWSSALKELGSLDAAPELWLVVIAAIAGLYLFEAWFVRYL